jgi:pyruvate dehydrogenase E1 component alpha subunit
MLTHDVELETPYQILDPDGRVIGKVPHGLTDEQMLGWYKMMWVTRTFSHKIVALQRQGRATTWGPLQGQEASAVAMGAPLQPQDWMTGSYREAGAYFSKGLPVAAMTYYTRGFGAPPELCKRDGQDVRCLPIQIVIATQTLHAVGLAMAAKIKGENSVVVGGCGDGATSEGDFNEALNFAGVFKAPVVLVVVNNGWAISTPRSKQSAARNLAARGEGFGVPARLVDGNDMLACYEVMKEATDRARAGEGPTLIEMITYRLGAHTTADDPTRYRPKEEIEYWERRDPIKRFKQFLSDRGILDDAHDRRIIEEAEKHVAEQVEIAHNHPTPGADGFFDNVFAELPPRLARQRAEFRQETAEGF